MFSFLKKYFHLFRKEAAFVTLISYFVGIEFGGKLDYVDVVTACFITFFSVNFIYSFNSWADFEIDKISKPHRPIPSGRVSPKHALVYSCVLLLISLLWPLWLFDHKIPIILSILLPILGIAYSAEPIRLRDRPYLSVFVIATGLVLPAMIAYLSKSESFEPLPLFIMIWIYCLGVVPLKKIEEVEEDRITGRINLFERWGRWIVFYSGMVLLVIVFLLWLVPVSLNQKIFCSILMGSTLIAIGMTVWFDSDLRNLYTSIIRLVIAESLLFFLYLKSGLGH